LTKQLREPSVDSRAAKRRAWVDRIIFFTVFSLAGPSTAFIGAWLKPYLGLGKGTPLWISILYFILITLPIHQALVLLYGWFFGRFRFFLDYEIRFFKKIGRFFTAKRNRPGREKKD
jgi:hypothetical protein